MSRFKPPAWKTVATALLQWFIGNALWGLIVGSGFVGAVAGAVVAAVLKLSGWMWVLLVVGGGLIVAAITAQRVSDRLPARSSRALRETSPAPAPPAPGQRIMSPPTRKSRDPRLYPLLLQEYVAGTELLRRLPSATGRLTWDPLATDADVQEWEDRVKKLLESEPRAFAHFCREPPLIMTTTFTSTPLHQRLQFKLHRLDALLKEFPPRP